MSKKLSISSLVFLFICIYPILPVYFFVSGISFYNYLSMMMGAIGVYIYVKRGRLRINLSFVEIILLIWVLIRGFELFNTKNITECILVLLRMIATYYVILIVINTKERFIKAINSIIYVFGIISTLGIIEFLTKFNIFSILNTANMSLNYNAVRLGVVRILSYHSQTIVYCVSLMFVASLTLYAMTLECNKKRKRSFALIYILICINALLTVSRSSILVFVCCQLLIAWKINPTKFAKRGILVLIIGVFVVPIFALISPKVFKFLENIVYMFLALVSPKYRRLVESAFGNDNISGVGNRVDLYSWVWKSLGSKRLIGKGYNAEFAYSHRVTGGGFAWNAVKETIEVQYLAILYYYGIVGLITEVIAYLTLLFSTIKGKFKPAFWESKISFDFIIFAILVAYYIEFFAVNQSSEARLFYVIVMLYLSYRKYKKYEI